MLFVALAAPCAGEDQVTTASNAPEPVRFGAAQLAAALAKANMRDVRVVVGVAGDGLLSKFPGARRAVPGAEESFVISVAGNQVAIEGRDAAGAMYGALEAAERAGWNELIQPVSKSPYLAIRGINTFLTPQGFDDPDSWYWSDEFWARFLDMMALSRHNFLDLHGPFDITVSFPNGFPFLVYLPDFPEVGVGRERAARNLERFRQIIRMAAARGVKVGYMNYTAAATIGPWKTGKFWRDERFVPRPQLYLPADRLEEYTRQAVRALLKELPELWMFGFRIGESGQEEDFYKKTYVEGLKDAPRSLKVYARTWIADPKRVRQLADLTGRQFYIEPKYNGEQLGLPYQAVTGGRYYPPSGSWEDYSNYPRNYSIIWQIRANGTHRVFHWGWPEFARRTARSCRFAGGLGFSMEPMNSYYPQDDYLHNNPDTKHNFYRWMFEQQWLWYSIWGRTGYDPDVPERVWTSEFERRFGPKAGALAYAALIESSKIVPLLYSYHNQGLDHQHMAPEFETGDHTMDARNTIWQGSRLVPFGGNALDFLKVGTLDRTAMLDPAQYAEVRLNGAPTGKMTPAEAAAYLDAAADASTESIRKAAELDPSSRKEFECIRMDVEAVAWLGRYYRDRILSASHLALYQRSYHHPELTLAHEYLSRAAGDWDRLSDATERHFGYVPEPIRMRVYKFRWRDEGRSIGLALEDLNRLEEEFRALPNRRSTIIGHVPPEKAEPGKALALVATLASAPFDAKLHLFYRNSPESGYTQAPMKLLNQFERTWTAEIPAAAMRLGKLEYYFESYEGISGAYGSMLEQRPPYAVRITAGRSRPEITHTLPPTGARGSTVELMVRVRDEAPVRAVRVWYKRMPAYHEWLALDMKPTGDGMYRVSVPLTPEGILYYFEAENADGNAVNYPHFLRQTPYFTIDGWDPGSG